MHSLGWALWARCTAGPEPPICGYLSLRYRRWAYVAHRHPTNEARRVQRQVASLACAKAMHNARRQTPLSPMHNVRAMHVGLLEDIQLQRAADNRRHSRAALDAPQHTALARQERPETAVQITCSARVSYRVHMDGKACSKSVAGCHLVRPPVCRQDPCSGMHEYHSDPAHAHLVCGGLVVKVAVRLQPCVALVETRVAMQCMHIRAA